MRKMKIIKTYLTIALLLTIFVSNAQVSKQQADNQIIDIFSIHSNCLIYSTNNSIGPGVNITTADGDSFTNPYNNSYVYFIDEMPSTNWSHQCKYCFLDTITGNYTIYSDDMYPQNYSVFRSISKNNSVSTIPWTGNANYATNPIIPDEHQWAILICSNSGTYINRFWGDLSCVYTTLTSRYGFIENESSDEFLYFNHIIVFAPEEITQSKPADLNNSGGYSNNDFITENNVYSNNKLIMYDKESLQIIFDNLSGNDNSLYRYGYRALDSLDKLFVYVTGHGYKSGNHSYIKLEDNNTTLTDTELADMVKDINCSQMTFLFQPCYCGGFIDDLSNTTNAKCKNRAIQTATSYNRYSHAEKYINHVTSSSWPSRGPDDDNYYVNEFTYYWCSALLGYYPIIRFNQTPIIGPWNTFENNTIGSFPWNMFFNETTLLNHDNVDVAPDIDNDGNVSMDEAYLFARKLDSWDTLGYFNPAEIYDPDGLYAVEYPQSAYESSFTKELITLNGYKGFIDSDAETGIGCRYLLDGYVKVVADASLTINDGCIINGNDHTIDNRGIFTTASGLINATFRNTHLINKASQRFTLSNCVFDTCDFIKTLDSDCSISNSTFNETRFEADTDNPPRDNYCVNLFENTFNNTIDTNSIYIKKNTML